MSIKVDDKVAKGFRVKLVVEFRDSLSIPDLEAFIETLNNKLDSMKKLEDALP